MKETNLFDEAKKHYKEITFWENKARLRLLTEFRDLVIKYFENSRLNMVSWSRIEEKEARDARDAINRILQKVYKIIRLADIKPSATSSPSLAFGGQGKNVDLILNIFNLGRNDIPPSAAIDYIERAMDVYTANRRDSFMRSINPLFWIAVMVNRLWLHKDRA